MNPKSIKVKIWTRILLKTLQNKGKPNFTNQSQNLDENFIKIWRIRKQNKVVKIRAEQTNEC